MTDIIALPRTALYIGGQEREGAGTLAVADPAKPGVICRPCGVRIRAGRGRRGGRGQGGVSGLVGAHPAGARRADGSPRSRASPTRRDEDAAILSQENGKIRFEAWVDALVLRDPLAARADPRRRGRHEQGAAARARGIPVTTTVAYQPLGVVTVIVPFNWPIAILGASLPHALLAGNTAIVKPPPTAPLATARVVQRVAEKLPPGVLNVVTGAGREHVRADPEPRHREGLLHRLA